VTPWEMPSSPAAAFDDGHWWLASFSSSVSHALRATLSLILSEWRRKCKEDLEWRAEMDARQRPSPNGRRERGAQTFNAIPRVDDERRDA